MSRRVIKFCLNLTRAGQNLRYHNDLYNTTARPIRRRSGNVLFEGGAGEKVRRKLLQECEVHTLLRLPTGIFYAQGVKANVIFFDRKPGVKEPWTKKVWIYDLRTNKEFTLKQRRMTRVDLDDFVKCYHPENRNQRTATWNEKKNPEGRWRAFTYEELAARDKCSLDIFWLKD